MVGRQEELDLLLEQFRGGRLSTVVIGGPAGVGKTRLGRETAEQLRGEAWDIESVGATAASAELPFGAFARLLPASLAPATGAAAAKAAGAATTIREVVAGLVARNAVQRLLLVVDDTHHLDQFSALLVHHLAVDGSVSQLLTLRSGERVPEPLPSLWKDGLARRIDLQPLAAEEVAALLARVLGGVVERASAEKLWQATAGHPLLLHEVVMDGLATGALAQAHDVWRWRPRPNHSIRLREVVAARMGELSPAQRRAVELVALSEPLPVPALQALAPDVDLAILEKNAVLRVEPDGLRQEARLWHPILSDVVRAETSVLDRRSHAADLAAHMQTVPTRRRSDVLRIALLQLESGDRSRPEVMAAAALEANALPDHELAERLARAAYTVAPSAAAALALGEASMLQGKFAGIEPVLETALDLAEDDATRARVAWGLAQLRYLLGRPADAVASLDAAALLVTDEGWRQVIDGHRAQQLLVEGRTKQALDEGEALLRRAVDGRVRLRLVTSLVPSRALAGRSRDALEYAAEAVPLAFQHQVDMPLGMTWVFMARAVALLIAGELTAAATHVGMAKAASDGLIRTDDFGVITLFEGRLALSAGRASDAAALLRETHARLQSNWLGSQAHWTLALVAEAEALRGDLDAAEKAAAQARDAWRVPSTYDTDAERALAWVAALGGERSRGVEQLRDVAERQAQKQLLALELQTRHDAYRLGDRSQAAAVLRVGDVVDGAWATTITAHVRAAEAGDAAGLEEAAGGFEDQGALLLAAESEADAAAAFGAAGLKSRATAARRRSAELAARCGPVRTPALVDIDAPPDLTRREKEVVALAARGLSNAEIAERLFVSVRTAEGHLLRAFVKLGVSDRAELRRGREREPEA